MVMPAFDQQLCEVDCVQCGQCVSVCPTGALTINDDTPKVWKALGNPKTKVIAQVAPAVRVALGEEFGHAPGWAETGKVVAALKRLGFDMVMDTSFTADLTVVEETAEFMARFTAGDRSRLPQFTSCCPAWVKYVEQRHPEYLPNLSTCRSPQQMFGSLARHWPELADDGEELFVVSIMPCTAKKSEAAREEFSCGGRPDVDVVLTTHELAMMIRQAGIDFDQLPVEPFDLPMGMATGAGMIFGNTGGVAEAVLRAAASMLAPTDTARRQHEAVRIAFEEVRGMEGVREACIELGDTTIRLAVAHSLGAAGTVLDAIAEGKAEYDLVEVMSCPGGCIGGAGQPVPSHLEVREKRAHALYSVDKMQMLRRAHDNPFVAAL